MGKLTNKVVTAIIGSKATEDQLVEAIKGATGEVAAGRRTVNEARGDLGLSPIEGGEQAQPTTRRGRYARRDMQATDQSSDTRHLTSENPE